MKCPKCGLESEGKYCSNCGTKLHEEGTNSTQTDKSTKENVQVDQNNLKTDNKVSSKKKGLIVGIVILCIAVVLVFVSPLKQKVLGTDYKGTYTATVIQYGMEIPYKVMVKDDTMVIRSTDETVKGKYNYDKDADCISMKINTEYGKQKFTLQENGDKYYLTLYGSTIQVAKGNKPAINDFDKDDTEDSTKEKSSKKSKTDTMKDAKPLSGDTYYVVGQDLPAGIYNFGPKDGESDFSITVYENMDYFNQSPDSDNYDSNGSDYLDHSEDYYDEDGSKGVPLREGNVLYVGYEGVNYSKQE